MSRHVRSEHDASSPRRRLIEAAGELFAEKGFHGTSVREIVSRAGMNVAAVSYHFGGKEQLYEAVLNEVFQFAAEEVENALAEELPPDGPEAQLSRYVEALLRCGLDPSRPAWHYGVHARELTAPTPVFRKLVKELLQHRFARLCGIVRAITKGRLQPDEERLYAASILGQCLFYLRGRNVLPILFVEWRLDEMTLRRVAGHITRFSLAALRDATEGGGDAQS